VKILDPVSLDLMGPRLIEASAGTGKTYTISSLFLRLIVDHGIKVKKILVVTFTEAATKELRHRIRLRIGQAAKDLASGNSDDKIIQKWMGDPDEARKKLLQALKDYDETSIFTIHAFCQKMLQETALESNVFFDTELVTDSRTLIDEIITDFWASKLYKKKSRIFARYLAQKKWLRSSFFKTVSQVVSQPDLEILPESAEKVEFEDEYQRAYEEVRTLWFASRYEIDGILNHDPGLNRSVYSKKTMKKCFDKADVFFKLDTPVEPVLPDHLVKMTQAVINKNIKKNHNPPKHPFFEAMDSFHAKEALLEKALLRFKWELTGFARDKINTRKQDENIQFFDDLLIRMVNALRGGSGEKLKRAVRRGFDGALIDEFQDTDRIQYEIFRTIFIDKGVPFILIGDPKQSIYSFRGADIFSYLEAVEVGKDNLYTLPTNWRSDPSLVKGINRFFNQRDDPFVFEKIKFKDVECRDGAEDSLLQNGNAITPVHLWFMNSRIDKNDIHHITACQIAKMLSNHMTLKIGDVVRPLAPTDIAVLVRTNRQALDMKDALKEYKIPCVLWSDASVYQSKAADDLYLLMSAAAAPSKKVKLKTALSTSILGFNSDQLAGLEDDDQSWESLAYKFREWRDLWIERGFVQMVRSILSFRPDRTQVAAPARLLKLSDGERYMTDLLHLIELLHNEAVEKHLSMDGLMKRFLLNRASSDKAPDSAQLRLESDEQAVKLVTIHKSKGLEYPVTICPYLWKVSAGNRTKNAHVLFHDPDDKLKPKVELDPQKFEALSEQVELEKMAEEMRILYVAMTRARHMSIAMMGAWKGFENSSLAYLLFPNNGRGGLEQAQSYIKSLDNDGVLEQLRRLADSSGNTIEVVELSGDETAPDFQKPLDSRTLKVKESRRKLISICRTSSFSSLAKEISPLNPDEEEGRDHDGPLMQQEGGMLESKIHLAGTVRHPQMMKGAGTDDGGEGIILNEFKKGAAAGDFFHKLFEDLDFQSGDFQIDKLVGENLNDYGYDVSKWERQVSTAVKEILHSQIDPNIRLDMISNKNRITEMEFIFPVEDRTGRENLTGTALARVFKEEGFTGPENYIDRLARLSFSPLKGFLKGFIDLVFVHKGRWYLLDYKSNHLGACLNDYKEDSMTKAMGEHHYYLQYHLYTTALHKYLKTRITNYCYEKHFGKVYYLFLRGVSKDTRDRYGVFKDKPKEQLIERLCALFGGPG